MPAIDKQIGDQRVRGLRIRARERGEHALIIVAAVGRAEREAVEILREVALAVEILLQPPLPGRREIERVHQRREQADIADADVRRRQSEMRGRLQTEREHFRVGRRDIGAPERFDAGLQDFARAIAAIAEHRAEIERSLARCRISARRDRLARPEW